MLEAKNAPFLTPKDLDDSNKVAPTRQFVCSDSFKRAARALRCALIRSLFFA